eukprot:TRINITY_DN17748_c0_g1_i1.p1 TRINITY_DN17748_c0_g1~~TRINITY_DN17748_c0_g1_i1.p1  ORF type:complete len:475 (-),score=109.46 TRINITY_DN17748_c0_g1_i1:60-1484(-)
MVSGSPMALCFFLLLLAAACSDFASAFSLHLPPTSTEGAALMSTHRPMSDEANGTASPAVPLASARVKGDASRELVKRWQSSPRHVIRETMVSLDEALRTLSLGSFEASSAEAARPASVAEEPLDADESGETVGGFSDWSMLASFSLVAFLVDLYVVSPRIDTMGPFWHFCMIVVWLCMACFYNAIIVRRHGGVVGVSWWTAYVLEWLLNVDNLFIFLLVFNAYRTPSKLRPTALLWWIPFGVCLRIFLFSVMRAAFSTLTVLKTLAGLCLLYSAVAAAMEGEDDGEESVDAERFVVVRYARQLFGARLLTDYGEGNSSLLVRDQSGNLCLSLLALVVVALAAVDCLFVFDSIGAKVQQVPNQYIANSAEVVALFGMRFVFVFIEDLVGTFALLKYGVCLVLAFLGVQLVLGGFGLEQFELSPTASTQIMLVIISASIILSCAQQRFGIARADVAAKCEDLSARKGRDVAGDAI